MICSVPLAPSDAEVLVWYAQAPNTEMIIATSGDDG